MTPRPWIVIVWEYIQRVADADGYFTLDDLRAHIAEMSIEKPDNRFVIEKVRQQLQILRDQGRISFLIPGSYRKTP